MRLRSGLEMDGLRDGLDLMVDIRIYTESIAVQLENCISEQKQNQSYVQMKVGNIVNLQYWKVIFMMAKYMMPELKGH